MTTVPSKNKGLWERIDDVLFAPIRTAKRIGRRLLALLFYLLLIGVVIALLTGSWHGVTDSITHPFGGGGETTKSAAQQRAEDNLQQAIEHSGGAMSAAPWELANTSVASSIPPDALPIAKQLFSLSQAVETCLSDPWIAQRDREHNCGDIDFLRTGVREEVPGASQTGVVETQVMHFTGFTYGHSPETVQIVSTDSGYYQSADSDPAPISWAELQGMTASGEQLTMIAGGGPHFILNEQGQVLYTVQFAAMPGSPCSAADIPCLVTPSGLSEDENGQWWPEFDPQSPFYPLPEQ